MKAVALRAQEIEPFRVMEILAQAKLLEAQGRDIIHLEIGEPDFVTPAPVIEAAVLALRAGLTHYTPALGLPALRQAIAGYYHERYGVEVDPARVCVTPGASGALLLAMASLFDPGDEILLADPGYPCNRHFARLMEAHGVGVPVGVESHFQLTAALVEQHWGPRTQGVLVGNPANPTGTLVSTQELTAIHAVVRGHGGWLLVDEIYHELLYDTAPPSAAALGDDVVLINSFSKYFLMTGWRLGWLLAPPAVVTAVERIAQNVFLAAPTVAQHAALSALSAEVRPLLEASKAELCRRRNYLLPQLADLGFDCPVTPEGAFYVYAGIKKFGMTSEELVQRCLLETGVALTPGTDFSPMQGKHYVRFAYTTGENRLQQAVDRLRQWL